MITVFSGKQFFTDDHQYFSNEIQQKNVEVKTKCSVKEIENQVKNISLRPI
jgi:RPA family protein